VGKVEINAMKLWVKTVAAIVSAGLSGCNSAQQPTVAAAAPAPTEAAPAPKVPSDSGFVASGPVVVENQLDVAALRDGVVVEIYVQPGDRVHAGQLLAKLDDRQISADVEAAAARVRSIEANLMNWKAENKVLHVDLERARKLWEAEVIPKEELEHVQYKAEADEYEIQRESESLTNARDVEKSLELEKEKTRITAPFDGLIARRYVRVGQKVSVSDRLFWVSAMAPLEVKFTLPERFLSKLHEGEQVTITSTDLPPDVKYAAKLTQIAPVIDPSSGTIEVLAQVIGSAPELRPGMLVNISLPNPR
jgi:RND family efflux transporter MFP subunit